MNKDTLLGMFIDPENKKRKQSIYFTVTSILSSLLLAIAIRTGILGTSDHFKNHGVWYLLGLAIMQVASSSVRVMDINKDENEDDVGWSPEKITNVMFLIASVTVIVVILFEKYTEHQRNKPKPKPKPEPKPKPKPKPKGNLLCLSCGRSSGSKKYKKKKSKRKSKKSKRKHKKKSKKTKRK